MWGEKWGSVLGCKGRCGEACVGMESGGKDVGRDGRKCVGVWGR